MSIAAGYPSFLDRLDGRIRPLRCTTEHLEGRKYNIIRFTTKFYKINEHLGQVITRPVVEFFWIDEIWRLYPTDHPEKRRLIGQVIEKSRPLGRSSWDSKILMLSRRSLQNMRFTGRNDSMPTPSRPKGRARALRSSGPFLARSPRTN